MQETNNNNIALSVPKASSASFLCNNDTIKFTQKFSEQENSFGVITNSTLIANMFAISGVKVKNMPAQLFLSICAGEQRGDSLSSKGFSGEHIIKRGHLVSFNQKSDPWLTLTAAAKDILSHLNELEKSDSNFAMAWAPEECAFVLALETPQSYGLYKHVLLTLYFNRDTSDKNVMTIGTLYCVPRDTFNEIRCATNKRYVHVSNQVAWNKVVRQWVPKVQPPVQKESNNTYEVMVESLVKNHIEEEVFVSAIPYFELLFDGFISNKYVNFTFEYLEKNHENILSFIWERMKETNELHEKYKNVNGRIAQDSDFITKNKDRVVNSNKGKELLEWYNRLIDGYFKHSPDYRWISQQGLNQLSSQEKVLGQLELCIKELKLCLQDKNEEEIKMRNSLQAMLSMLFLLNNNLKECSELATETFSSSLSLAKEANTFLYSFLKPVVNFLQSVLQKSLNPKEYPKFVELTKLLAKQQGVIASAIEFDNHVQAFSFLNANQLVNPSQAFRNLNIYKENITKIDRASGKSNLLELFKTTLDQVRQKYPEAFPKVAEENTIPELTS